MTVVEAKRYTPALRVGGGGQLGAVPSGSFQWIVHRRRAPVAFLATPLMALGEGDELDARVELGPGASVAVTTQGPTSLLKTGCTVTQRWTLELGQGAHLTFLPWLTIPFPGCRSRVEITARLGPGSSLVAWDTLAVGRVASGERFLFDELRSTWRISGPDGTLLHDRIAVRGCDRAAAEAMLGGRTHLGSLYVAGLAENALPAALVRDALDGRVQLAGVSRPTRDLLVVRALDTAAEKLEQAFWPVVDAARDAAGFEPITPGKVARRWFT